MPMSGNPGNSGNSGSDGSAKAGRDGKGIGNAGIGRGGSGGGVKVNPRLSESSPGILKSKVGKEGRVGSVGSENDGKDGNGIGKAGIGSGGIGGGVKVNPKLSESSPGILKSKVGRDGNSGSSGIEKAGKEGNGIGNAGIGALNFDLRSSSESCVTTYSIKRLGNFSSSSSASYDRSTASTTSGNDCSRKITCHRIVFYMIADRRTFSNKLRSC